jgi:N-methylhydantoinase B
MARRVADVITLEVLHNRLEAIVEEMGLTMLKTAHSVHHYESKDFSVALFGRTGDLLAMGQYIPHHQGGMQNFIKHILERDGVDSIRDGDAYIINDPFVGGTHLQDILVFRPVFLDGVLVGFAGCAAHHTDVGGMTAGGYAPTATESYQEGIVFPGIKLIENGVLRDDVLRLFTRNVRLPLEQRGDLLAQVGAIHIGARRMLETASQWQCDEFLELCDELIDLTERRVRAAIERLPDGTYEVEDALEHDGNTPAIYRIALAMTISGSDVTLDFTGTADQAAGFINASRSNAIAAAYAAFILFLDPAIPRNSGFFRPIEVIAPEGTIVNPRFPAPTSGSTTEVGGIIYDVALHALSLADPERGIGTWPMMWVAVIFGGIHPRTGRRFIHFTLDGLATGGGARSDADGWNASHVSASTCLIPNVEIEEQAYPVRYLRRGLSADSGGAGRWRGGLAIETEIMLEVACEVTTFGSRRQVRAPGIFGGHAGGPSRAVIRRADGSTEILPAKAVDIPLEPGDSFIMRASGGGGYGDPRERPRELVLADLQAGYITADALAAYGIAADSVAEGPDAADGR